MQPPPPTGTTTRSGSVPSWLRISTAMVPWPAMVRGSSYGGHQRRPGAGDVVERRRGGQVVGRAADDQLDELAAVVADPVALLLGRLARHVHPAVHAHRPAGQRESLRVVARRGAHHPGAQLLVGQLLDQVVGTAQLVGPDGLQVFALEVDLGAGGRGQPVAVLQRADRHRRRQSAGRPRRCQPRSAAASSGSGSVRRTPNNGATTRAESVNRGQHEHRDLRGRFCAGSRHSRARPRRRAPTRSPSRRRTPRGPRSRGSRCRPATRRAGWP